MQAVTSHHVPADAVNAVTRGARDTTLKSEFPHGQLEIDLSGEHRLVAVPAKCGLGSVEHWDDPGDLEFPLEVLIPVRPEGPLPPYKVAYKRYRGLRDQLREALVVNARGCPVRLVAGNGRIVARGVVSPQDHLLAPSYTEYPGDEPDGDGSDPDEPSTGLARILVNRESLLVFDGYGAPDSGPLLEIPITLCRGSAPNQFSDEGVLRRALTKLLDAMEEDRGSVVAQLAMFHSRFHDYSPLNRLLISLQDPTATFVASRTTWWRKHKRRSIPNARPLHVITPVRRTIEMEGRRGKPPVQLEGIDGYSSTAVFDVSQTEGKPFQPPASTDPSGPEQASAELLENLEAWITGSGLELVRGLPPGYANTSCEGATDGYRIWVSPHLPPNAQCAVLAHEIAHVVLHFDSRRRGNELEIDEPGPPTRGRRELEAELTAWLILAMVGVDATDGAAGYLVAWQAPRAEVEAVFDSTIHVASAILRQCESGEFRHRGKRSSRK